jgi:hypothetical protein
MSPLALVSSTFSLSCSTVCLFYGYRYLLLIGSVIICVSSSLCLVLQYIGCFPSLFISCSWFLFLIGISWLLLAFCFYPVSTLSRKLS